MRLAADLAGRSQCPPALAPPTGCVLLDRDSRWLAASETSRAGTHPELSAIRRATQTGPHPRGGTAVLTMEPCRDCANALIRAGIERVVYAVTDPRNGGAAVLLAAGVDVVPGICETEVAAGALRPWLSSFQHGEPYVTWIHAASPFARLALLRDAGMQVLVDLMSFRGAADVSVADPEWSMMQMIEAYPAALHILVEDSPGQMLDSVSRIVQYMDGDFRGALRIPECTSNARLVSADRMGDTSVRMIWDIEK